MWSANVCLDFFFEMCLENCLKISLKRVEKCVYDGISPVFVYRKMKIKFKQAGKQLISHWLCWDSKTVIYSTILGSVSPRVPNLRKYNLSKVTLAMFCLLQLFGNLHFTCFCDMYHRSSILSSACLKGCCR